MFIQMTKHSCENADADSVGRESRLCISKKPPDESDVVSQWTTFCVAKFV